MKLLRILVRIGLAIAALAIVIWLAFGSLSSPIQFHSPINAESWFVFACVLALVLASWRFADLPPDGKRPLDRMDALAIATVALAVVAAFAWTSRFYFLSDDFYLLGHASGAWTKWSTLWSTPGGDGFFRPLGYLFYTLSWQWADFDPARWHWIGFLLHAANSALVYLLVRELGYSRFAAWLAGILFVLHGTRPEAVVWMASRFDLLASFFVLAGLVCLLRYWDDPTLRRIGYLAVALVSMMTGMLSKESAYAFPLIIMLLALVHEGGSAKRLWSTVPFLAAAAALFVWRWTLVGGIGGYRTASGVAEASLLSAASVAKALFLRLGAILAFPINWSIPAGAVLAGLTFIYVLVLAWLVMRPAGWRKILVALGFTFLAALPPISQLLIGMDLEKSRVLYLPSVGFCMFLAILADRVSPKHRAAVAAVFILFQGAALWHNLAAWDIASRAEHTTCVAVSSCSPGKALVIGLPRMLNGVYAFANAFPNCVAMQPGGKQVEVTMQNEAPADASGYSCVFEWDGASGSVWRAK